MPAPKKSSEKAQTEASHRPGRDRAQGADEPRIRIKIRSYDHKIIDQNARMIIETAERTGATIRGPIPLPTEKTRYTVLRSSFVHKNSQEHYEMRLHKRLIDIIGMTPKTVESLTNLNLPAGVDVEIKMM